MLNKSFQWSLSKLANLWSDSLYRNSFWLMAGSFSMTGIGFFYWIIAAHLYTPEQIGLAATFLSAASLINGFAMLGFGPTLIRYLPISKVKESKINTAFTVVFIVALFIGIIYLIGLPLWTQKLMFIRASIPALLITIIFFPIYTINGITDFVFTAFRRSFYVFVSNVTQSIAKLLALILLSTLGVWGVIGSNIIATVIAVILCLILITTRFGIHFRPTIDKSILSKVQRFAFTNYLSSLIGTLPIMILPIIITNRISPEQTAYYYMPTMITGLLTIIPSTISRSYFTESSHFNKPISFKKPLLVSYAMLFPLVILFIVFGRFILNLYGKNYYTEGYIYLVLSSISVLISAISFYFSYRLLIKHNLRLVIKVQTVSAIVLIALALNLSHFGIKGIGISLLITKILEVLIFLLNYKSSIKL
jgi:O-antigen/teichoic acid export membrane protein